MQRIVVLGMLAALSIAIGLSEAADDAELAARIAQLVKDLDSDDFATRENATNALVKIGKPAAEALKKALAARPGPEAVKRLERILAEVDPAPKRDNQALSPDGKLLAKGNGNNVDVLDAASSKVVRTFAGHKGAVTTVAFSPDGKFLASGSNDGTVSVWDPGSGKQIQSISVGAAFAEVSYSADGGTLTCKTVNRTVYVFDSRTGAVVNKFVEGEK